MQRFAAETIPLPCYGTEFSAKAAQCQTCEHSQTCQVYMGKRLGKVQVDQAKFQLVPAELRELASGPDDELQFLYADCFRLVFKTEPDNLTRRPEIGIAIRGAAAKFKCSPVQFMLTVMYAYNQASPGSKFYATMLSGDAAVRRFERYRTEIINNHGTLDDVSIDTFFATELTQGALHNRLLTAEIMFGAWIVGYKLKKGGMPYAEMYDALEFRMDPIWLALEPTYYEHVLKPWLADSNRNSTNRARVVASRTYGQLHKNRHYALRAMELRQAAMPIAIQKVLRQHGYQPDDFKVSPVDCWTKTSIFWAHLALSIQHWNTIQAYDKRKSPRAAIWKQLSDFTKVEF